MDSATLRKELIGGGLPESLLDELLGAFSEAKGSHLLGGHRLSAVEGGRFCEAAYRLLEYITTNSYTGLDKRLDTEKIASNLRRLSAGSFSDSIRLHIPRALRVVYDVRNKRNAAHLGDGIDSNIQDSSLVIACLSWIMAEFIRLYHDGDIPEATRIIEELVTWTVPVIQTFDGVPRVLTDLPATDTCLILLYYSGSAGMTKDVLRTAVEPEMRKHLSTTLQRLNKRKLIHDNGELVRITRKGEKMVRDKSLARDL